MGAALFPTPAFLPPCNLQNIMACRRNDRTYIQLCKHTHTHENTCFFTVCCITALIFGSLLSLYH